MSSGTIVVGGVAVPVTSITLAGGQIAVNARLQGPAPAATGPVTIFGEDGIGICQCSAMTWPVISDYNSVEIVVKLQVMAVCE